MGETFHSETQHRPLRALTFLLSAMRVSLSLLGPPLGHQSVGCL